MLAVYENSLILLINPESARLATLPIRFRSRVERSRTLLCQAAQLSGVSMGLLGAIDDPPTFSSLANCRILSGDTINFWRQTNVVDHLGPPNTHVVYVGGAWLDQDVLVAALTAAEIGYDTRVLVDVSIAQTQFDRDCAVERLVQHDVLVTTVRQMMSEWLLTSPENDTARQLRDIPQS